MCFRCLNRPALAFIIMNIVWLGSVFGASEKARGSELSEAKNWEAESHLEKPALSTVNSLIDQIQSQLRILQNPSVQLNESFGGSSSLSSLMQQGVTARTWLPIAESAAATLASDARLVSIAPFPPVGLNGTAMGWIYTFFSESANTSRVINIAGGTIINQFDTPGIGQFTGTFDTNFIDSDEAVTIAEQNGGQDFRSANPDAMIFLLLSASSELQFFPEHSCIPTFSHLAWLISYASLSQQGRSLDVFVEGITGELLVFFSFPPDPSLFTARELLGAAENEAQQQLSSPKLVGILGFEAVSTDQSNTGKSPSWMYVFKSQSRLIAIAADGSMINALVKFGSDSGAEQLGKLISNFVDSRLALEVAENNGGRSFRQANPMASVEMTLFKAAYEPDRSKTVWIVSYRAEAIAELILAVDAANGVFLGELDPQDPIECEDNIGIVPGDINNDGTINVSDLIDVINFILNLATPTAEQFAAADVNGDGVLNVGDLIAIINIILGLN